MKLTCPKSIISDHLLLNFDLTSPQCWDTTDFTLTSLTKWKNAKVNNINLPDWGLTAFDNGMVNNMLSGLTLTTKDDRMKLYHIGYNVITNHTGYTLSVISGTTTGYTIAITGVSARISYSGLTISGISTSLVGPYLNLNGGYLQGFFKLHGVDYQLLPTRYNEGFTVENLLYLTPESQGIFYLMGTRAEDKYNPPFSGETGISGVTSINIVKNNPNCDWAIHSGITSGYQYKLSGITTSLGNHLDSYEKKYTYADAFKSYETQLHVKVDTQPKQINNLKNNIISFEFTPEQKLAYRYINSRGNVVYNESVNTYQITGWTAISITYQPDILLKEDDDYGCYPLRKGTLSFYINGRLFWIVKNVEETIFKHLANSKEKQLDVPYNISWGGGSFGLEHSYHFNTKTNNPVTLIVQDPSKNNLLIQQNFNNNFIGGIQKFRFYDKPLTQNEILSNLIADTSSNPNYNLLPVKGGRIIYNTNSQNPYTTEQQWVNYINIDETIEPNDYLEN